MTRPFDHSTIQDGHPRRLMDLKDITSLEIPFKLVPKPTRRYLRKLSLEYMCCPDCESKDITFYGKSSIGTQKHKCNECGYQFVAQFDALFPKSSRRELFEQEYVNNLEATGFDKGTGKKKYWKGARVETLQMIESQIIKVRINKLLKEMMIEGDREYKSLIEFVVHEAYVYIVA